MHWFATTEFRDQSLSKPVLLLQLFMANIGSQKELFATMRLANRKKMSRTRIKVGYSYKEKEN